MVPAEVAVGDLVHNDDLPQMSGIHRRADTAGSGAAAGRTSGLRLAFPLALPATEVDPWGWRFSESRNAWRMHTGIDLIVPEGTAVLAVQAGTVRVVERISGYGLTVVIEHHGPNGLTPGLQSLYAHLLDAAVKPGDAIGRGELLGRVGQSGNASTPHLHLELRRRGAGGLVAVDPGPLLPGFAPGVPAPTLAPTLAQPVAPAVAPAVAPGAYASAQTGRPTPDPALEPPVPPPPYPDSASGP